MLKNNHYLGSIFLQAAAADKDTATQAAPVEYGIVASTMECQGECGQITPHEHLGRGWSCSVCGTFTKDAA
jgi:hypothetical protein